MMLDRSECGCSFSMFGDILRYPIGHIDENCLIGENIFQIINLLSDGT